MFTDIPHDCCNEETGLPVKNHLPPELGARFKTRKQWREWGYEPKPGEQGHRMHPSSLAYRSYVYFHESEVCSYAGTEPADDVRYQTHVSKKTVALEECTGHGGLAAIGIIARDSYPEYWVWMNPLRSMKIRISVQAPRQAFGLMEL